MKRLILIAAAAALASACSPQAPANDPPPPAATADAKMADAAMPADKMDMMGMMAPAAGDTEATRGYKAAMMDQVHGMPAFGGDPDVDFMKQMRGHHQAAVAMANKNVRILWAMMTKGCRFDAQHVSVKPAELAPAMA